MTDTHTQVDNDLLETIEEFYRTYYSNQIAELAQKYPRDQQSLWVEWMDINKFDPRLADDVRKKPDQMQEYFQEALRLYDLPAEVDLTGAVVRFGGLTDPYTYAISQIGADHRKQLIQVQGQVKKRSKKKPRVTMAAFECQRCGTLIRIPQDEGRKMQEPHECQGCERQGPFRINYNQSEFVDHQLVRIQTPPEKTKGGQGAKMEVVCERDLVETVEGGDRVTMTGILELEQEDERQKSVTYETYLRAHDYTIEQTDYDDIDVDEYETEIQEIAESESPIQLLRESLTSEIYGHDHIKTAITLQMFSGTSVAGDIGSEVRGDFHILLIGDPGCGKSTLLDAAESIAPRSVKASGKGASKAGLTAAAVQDSFGNSEWSLEAGALVMADKGISCIDEIDKIDEETTSALHDALEDQLIPINKAGINTKLPSRSSLLAAGNPKFGRFDSHEPIADQIDIDPPLMSRFDLIFTVMDAPDEERDRKLAKHVLDFNQQMSRAAHRDEFPDDTDDVPVEEDVFRAYIAYAKQNYHPIISDKTKDKLIERYVSFRSSAGDESAIPITPRYIGALIRLSQAAARARLSDTVTEEDMELAVELVTRSLQDVGMDPESGELDADIIETGMASSQRDRILTIKSIIQEIEDEYNKGAPHEVVIDRADEAGIERESAQHEIKKLKDQGEIYEARSEHYRTS